MLLKVAIVQDMLCILCSLTLYFSARNEYNKNAEESAKSDKLALPVYHLPKRIVHAVKLDLKKAVSPYRKLGLKKADSPCRKVGPRKYGEMGLPVSPSFSERDRR